VETKYIRRILWKSFKKTTRRKLKLHMKLQLWELSYNIRSWAEQFYVIKVMDFAIGAGFPNFSI